MRKLLALVLHEARECRASLIGAGLVSAVALTVVHAVFPASTVAQASAFAVAILTALWTLYFASDLFATDCASGRMRTKSFLPVASIELWSAKIAFLVLTIVSIAAWTLGAAYALRLGFGGERSIAHFEGLVAVLLAYAPFLALAAAAAVACSLLVDSGLVAMLLAVLVATAIGGVGVLVSRGLTLVGVAWGGAAWQTTAACAAILVLCIGAFAFARGQRRFGARGVRARVVLASSGALVVLGCVGGASELYRRATASLEHPRTRFQCASPSRDGRYLAIETETEPVMAHTHGARSVWMLDLETKESTLVVWPGLLRRDWITGFPLPWDGMHALAVESLSLYDDLQRFGGNAARVEADGAGWTVVHYDTDTYEESRVLPAWAETSRDVRRADGSRALRVRWAERGLEHVVVGEAAKFSLGRAVLISPTPGRILERRDDVLYLVDMERGESKILLSGIGWWRTSADGSAILVACGETTHALSTLDGAPLAAPWDHDDGYVQWVEGAEGAGRIVRIRGYGRVGGDRVLDLDTGVEFAIEIDGNHHLLRRLFCGDYVYVDAKGDLVRVDSRGKLVDVLIDR